MKLYGWRITKRRVAVLKAFSECTRYHLPILYVREFTQIWMYTSCDILYIYIIYNERR